MDNHKIVSVVHFQVTLSFSDVVEIFNYGAREMTMAKATKMSKDFSAQSEGPAYTFFFSFSCVFGVFRLLKKVMSRKSVHDASYRFFSFDFHHCPGRQTVNVQFALQTTKEQLLHIINYYY